MCPHTGRNPAVTAAVQRRLLDPEDSLHGVDNLVVNPDILASGAWSAVIHVPDKHGVVIRYMMVPL